MKKFLIALAFCVNLFATNPDDILGKWLYINEKGEQVHIEVYKQGDRYYGKIVWLQYPNYDAQYLIDNDHPENENPNIKLGGAKIDYKNPDPARRNDPVIGMVIMRGVKFDADDSEWNDGYVYKADEGKLYTCFAALENPDRLKLKGYVAGMTFLGKSRYWDRIK